MFKNKPLDLAHRNKFLMHTTEFEIRPPISRLYSYDSESVFKTLDVNVVCKKLSLIFTCLTTKF